jgi:hypothetical protein
VLPAAEARARLGEVVARDGATRGESPAVSVRGASESFRTEGRPPCGALRHLRLGSLALVVVACGARAGGELTESAEPGEQASTQNVTEPGPVECAPLPLLGGDIGAGNGLLECSIPSSYREHYFASDLSAGCPGAGGGPSVPRIGSASNAACQVDADCPEGAQCLGSGASGTCRLSPVCETNSDCPVGQACFCASDRPDPERGSPIEQSACLPAECLRAEDCGEFGCSVSVVFCGPLLGAFCHTAEDECRGPRDCLNGYCLYDQTARHWYCQGWHTCR